jgi:predicted transcriptional regulator
MKQAAISTQGIKLDAATRERLKALGEARQRSPHWLMKDAIERYLEHEEAFEREKREDMERWRAYQLTGVAIPHEETDAWLRKLADGEDAACSA